MSIEKNQVNERIVKTIESEHVISLENNDNHTTLVSVVANIDTKNGTNTYDGAAAEMIITFTVAEWEDSYDYATIVITDSTPSRRNTPYFMRELTVEVASKDTYRNLLMDGDVYNMLIASKDKPKNSDIVFSIIKYIIMDKLSTNNSSGLNNEDVAELEFYIRSILKEFPANETTHATTLTVSEIDRSAFYYHAPIRKGE